MDDIKYESRLKFTLLSKAEVKGLLEENLTN
jgi:hypothetical protein